MPVFDLTFVRDFPNRAIRRLLEHPANLRDLLTTAVPQLADGFDCPRASLVPPVFPLDDWRYRESDLLFLIPYRTGKGTRPVLVCVLIEHQSEADPRMPLRVLLYTVLFWQREWKTWEERPAPRPPLRLTPVLPIVFHTGPRPWRAARSLGELLAGPDAFRVFAPQYQPLFWDLAEQSPQALLESAAAWLEALAVIRAKSAEREEFLHVMEQVVQRLSGLARRDQVRWDGLIWFVLAWAMHYRPQEEHNDLIARAQAAVMEVKRRKEIRTVGQTIAEWLQMKGRQEGRQE